MFSFSVSHLTEQVNPLKSQIYNNNFIYSPLFEEPIYNIKTIFLKKVNTFDFIEEHVFSRSRET